MISISKNIRKARPFLQFNITKQEGLGVREFFFEGIRIGSIVYQEIFKMGITLCINWFKGDPDAVRGMANNGTLHIDAKPVKK